MIPNKNCGFTLIEIMVVVVIISILSAIAIPAYKDYVIRSKITQAIGGLSGRQVRMEQCYQDNHVYNPTGGCAACASGTDGDFAFSCTAEAATFTLTATGNGTMAGFVYTVDQSDAKETTGVPDGWGTTPASCWITRKGEPCAG
jgi:type IV pilus assembly protein PilE